MGVTRTYAVLEVSKGAFHEIANRLRKAEYHHVFCGDEIDMHGLHLKPLECESVKERVRRLEIELLQAKSELYRAEVAALPWRVGSVLRQTVKTVRHAIGDEHKVIEIKDVRMGWPRVVTRRKTGEWGTRETTLYDKNTYEVIGYDGD